MLKDPRAKAKMRGFFQHWLELEERDLAKDKAIYPQFDERVISDLRYSLESFIEQVVWSETSDYRELLTADYLVLNQRLLNLYQPSSAPTTEIQGVVEDVGDLRSDQDGPFVAQAASTVQSLVASEAADRDHAVADDHPADRHLANGKDEIDSGDEQHDGGEAAQAAAAAAPGGSAAERSSAEPLDEFRQVVLVEGRRAGVLTHPYLLSAFAYHNNTSPIHRGVFLTRNIVGRGLKPPPVAVAFKDDEFSPDLTMREKITQLTRDSACISCHSVINPLGFALENYDAVGRWRTMDRERPVKTDSEYVTIDGQKMTVRSAHDIANYAIGSPRAHRAFVSQLFHHLVKQPPEAFGHRTIEELRLSFAASEFNIQKLIAHITQVSAGRKASSPATATKPL